MTITSVTSATSLRTAIEIILQDDCRRGRVEPRLSRSPVLVPYCEPALGFSAREPLVLQRHGQRGSGSKLSREQLDAQGHVGRCSIETSRQADDNRADAIFFFRETRNFAGHHVQRV